MDRIGGGLFLSAQKTAVELTTWMEQYGKAGLLVTLLRPADGVPQIDYRPDRAAHYVPMRDSAEEAAFWHWYDQVYHRVPATLAVSVVHTTQWLPAPDGRRLTVADGPAKGYLDLAGTAIGAYGGQGAGLAEDQNTVCTLVGRDGTVIYRHDGQYDQDIDWHGWGEVLAVIFGGTHGTSVPVVVSPSATASGPGVSVSPAGAPASPVIAPFSTRLP